MTTTPLIPPVGPAQAAPAPPASPQADGSPAFRDVLASQSAPRQEAQAPKDGTKESASSSKSPAGDAVSTGKPAKAGKKADDRKSPATDEPATVSGPALPGIALYIAAEAHAALAHPPQGNGAQAADGNQKAGPAKLARPGSIPPGPASVPDNAAEATASLARPAAAGAGAQAAQLAQTEAAGEALPGAAPEPAAARGALRPAPGHEKTTSMATATAPSPSKAAHARPAGLPGAGPDNGPGDNPPHAMPESTHRTLVHTASESTPALLATPPAATTPPPSPSTTLTGATPAISVPLQSPHWPGELGRQFVAIAQSSQPGLGHTAQLRLDPPNLGPLHIAIHVSDNVAQAVFFSPHAQVRQAVENALPQLQQQLAQAGIALGQASVSDQGTPRQAFDHDAPPPRRRASGSVTGAAMTTNPSAMPQQARTSAGDALVDTFA